MPDKFDVIINSWKKNISFLFVLVLFLSSEILYITSIVSTADSAWYERINLVYVAFVASPSLVALAYIVYKRLRVPKAKRGTKGIAFYVVNANTKQYEAINKKFIGNFQRSLNSENSEYSVIVIDDYHSEKYYPLLCRASKDSGEQQAKMLEKRRCCAAILIDCQNGGDGEELFCRMTMNIGIAHHSLPPQIKELMVKDISLAFAPLQEIDIMKITETPDFSQHSFSFEIIYKYILASTAFHCGDHLGALSHLTTIERKILCSSELPSAVLPISRVLGDRIAACYRVQALIEYQKYCIDRRDEHLLLVREAISNEHCKSEYDGDNKILEGICSFVLDRDVNYAMKCMDAYKRNDPVIKFNKVFLSLYSKCTTNNVFKAYNLYKGRGFSSLSEEVQDQIEGFTYNEYNKDKSKKQLLLILFLIYDSQGNNPILAKRCLDQFCEAFDKIVLGDAASIFGQFREKYKDVVEDDGEEYCL